MFCVGLTGGIGCGKSTVAERFAALGATVVDTDVIAHHLTQTNQPGYEAILRSFGAEYRREDGNLDRARLRRLIFCDARAKAALENLLHPLIFDEVVNALRALTSPYAILVVPLLFETRQYLCLIQRSVVVDCDESQQVARTYTRSGLSEAEVRSVMAHQLNRALRLRDADDIIHNEGDVDALELQVTRLHQLYLTKAKS